MRILETDDYGSMSRKAAWIIFSQVTLKPDSVLGLATGSSPIGTYEELVRLFSSGDLDFSKVKTVNLDEYKGLGPEDPQSYRYFMNYNLFSKININQDSINIPRGEDPDASRECLRYDRVIESLGGIDLQLLGIGRNGHIGFNEPGDSFPKSTHCTALTESTIEANKRFFERVQDVPRFAYTMGIGSIMGAKSIVMVASGKAKADIVKKAFAGPITPMVPASVLQLHPCFTLVGDKEALSQL